MLREGVLGVTVWPTGSSIKTMKNGFNRAFMVLLTSSGTVSKR